MDRDAVDKARNNFEASPVKPFVLPTYAEKTAQAEERSGNIAWDKKGFRLPLQLARRQRCPLVDDVAQEDSGSESS